MGDLNKPLSPRAHFTSSLSTRERTCRGGGDACGGGDDDDDDDGDDDDDDDDGGGGSDDGDSDENDIDDDDDDDASRCACKSGACATRAIKSQCNCHTQTRLAAVWLMGGAAAVVDGRGCRGLPCA